MTELNESIKDIPMPLRIQRLPISDKGFPVPWFVPYVDDRPVPQAANPAKRRQAVKENLCWVCGERLGIYKAFVLGPMCAVSRTTAEPPCHLECAQYTVKACPFLAKPKMRRNPSDVVGKEAAPGFAIERNPGVALIWITKTFRTFSDNAESWLIEVGDPTNVLYFREGRPARRDEILASMESGLPILEKMAYTKPAKDQLERQYREAVSLLPPA